MRERIWLLLRNSELLRKLYGFPFFAEPMRLASYALLPSSGQRRLRVRTGPAEGLVFELNPRWEHGAWQGSYEASVQQQFTEFIKPGLILFDVGANYGFYSLLAASKNARVIAFEPDQENAKVLKHHAALNGLIDRICIVERAVFSYTGHIALIPPEEVGVHGNAHTIPGHSSQSTLQVPCTTLDDFIEHNPAPNVVKMDVEGAESEVFKGADRLFRIFRPVILCEIHDNANATFAQEWLRERGYVCQWLEDDPRFPRHLLGSPEERHSK
jgi:FkbM family methyltransferase